MARGKKAKQRLVLRPKVDREDGGVEAQSEDETMPDEELDEGAEEEATEEPVEEAPVEEAPPEEPPVDPTDETVLSHLKAISETEEGDCTVEEFMELAGLEAEEASATLTRYVGASLLIRGWRAAAARFSLSDVGKELVPEEEEKKSKAKAKKKPAHDDDD